MKRYLLLLASFLCYFTLMAQVVYEDFEDGGSLTWTANNGTYNGIVANPDTTGINASANVGSYTKSGEHSFSLFITELDSALDLSENNIFRVQVWSPVASELLLKLEGGTDPAIEGRKLITEDSTWVDLTFDFRTAANRTTFTKIILFFDPGVAESANTYLFDNLRAMPAPDQVVWEDFEDGSRLNWMDVNGTFTGVIENPDTTGINKSLNVGSYTKSGEHGFSQLRVDLDDPIDFSVLNHVSLQVYAPEKTEFILKFQGDGGAIEKRTNIPTQNKWREYNFDFSGAEDMTNLKTILIFFDPGVTESDDTYLFDNFIVKPSGACAGTIPLAGVVDDFECQRNATYDNGWDRITAIDNPDPSIVNSSVKVGAYSKPSGEAWAALGVDYDNPIDLSELNVVKANIWTPAEGRILFKLEGGASPAREIFIDFPSTNQWVAMSADFSQYAAENHKRLLIFFSAGTSYDTDTTFYIDDIVWSKKESQVLEDFDTTKLAWIPLNADMTQHGTFEVIANPDPTPDNNSPNVGSYTKGTSNFSALSAILTTPLDFSEFAQLNLQVWAPADATKVTMQLVSTTQGNVSFDADIEETEKWVTLAFDFSMSANIIDFSQINLLFDATTSVTGPYYIDNLTLGETTVDPCEDVVTDPLVIDNFECQRNVEITTGAADIEPVLNPDINQDNPSTTVGQYTEPTGPWASMVYNFGDANPIDLSVFNILRMKVWAPSAVPILFKLEGGEGNQEVFVDVTETDKWVNYSVDFSESIGKGHTRLVLFINAGNEPTVGEVFYIDDIQWVAPPYEACIFNFENELGTIFNEDGWEYFANSAVFKSDSMIQVISNPAPDGVNMSEKVGRFVEAAGVGDGSDGVDPWAGVFIRNLTPINFADETNKTISMDVWMDHAAQVGLKLEAGLTISNMPDNLEQYDTPNQWKTMTWDFSGFPNDQWTTVSLIFDIDNIPTENKVYYFDNIRVGGTSCETTVGIFDVEPVPSFNIVPNPTHAYIQFKTPENFDRLEIVNIYGQRVLSVNRVFTNESQIDVGHLTPGLYVAMAMDRTGKVIGNGKFIKE